MIEALARTAGVRVSVDTRKAAVAAAAVAAGAAMVNDVSAGRHDPDLLGVVAEAGRRLVPMHMLGDPGDHAGRPALRRRGRRGRDVPGRARRLAAESPGSNEVWIDPGIGFGKT